MKTQRSAPRGERQEQHLSQLRDDSYRGDAKMADPATCPRCKASYVKGRWTWGRARAGAARHTCPACQRIEDQFPAGYVTLKGEFLDAHREEILNAVNAHAARAAKAHALQRVMAIEQVNHGLLVTTTDAHLARGIAVALHHAFKGSLDLQFSQDENLIRATWSR